MSRARGTTPTRLSRHLRGDLDNIVLKAMRKEPHRRYASVQKLADDLDSYLANRPVAARRDTLRYRAAKFVRRHATGVAATLLVLVVLAAGTAGVLLQARVAARERDAAETIAAFLDTILSSASPARQGRGYTVAEALDRAAARIDMELAEQPEVQASLHGTVGRAYFALGLYGPAEVHLRRSLAVRRRLSGHTDVPVIGCLNDLCKVLHGRGAFAEAEGLLREALAAATRWFGEEHVVTALTRNNLAAVRARLGDLDEAERLYREALATRRRRLGPEDLQVAETLNNLAGLARGRGRPAEAVELMQEALRIRRRRLKPDHPLVLQSASNLAAMLGAQGRFEEAEPLLRQALARGRAVLGAGHPDLAWLAGNLGALLLATGRHEEAIPLLEESLRIGHRTLRRDHPRMLRGRLHLGECLIRARRFGRAERVLLGLHRTLADRGRAAAVEAMLVRLYTGWGRPEEAEIWRARQASARPDGTRGDEASARDVPGTGTSRQAGAPSRAGARRQSTAHRGRPRKCRAPGPDPAAGPGGARDVPPRSFSPEVGRPALPDPRLRDSDKVLYLMALA